MRKRVLTRDAEISKEIEYYIRSSGLKEGARLPSERDLAADFGVQRDTVRCALEILLSKGVLIRKPRQGYFVAPKRIVFDLNNMTSMTDVIERTGRRNKAVLINFDIISLNDQLADRTLLPEGTLCYRIVRLRYENDVAIAIERSYLPAEIVPDLREEDVNLKSLSDTLRSKYRIHLATSRQRITRVNATDVESELLKVKQDEALMRYEGMVYDRRDRLIEYYSNVLLIDAAEFCANEFA